MPHSIRFDRAIATSACCSNEDSILQLLLGRHEFEITDDELKDMKKKNPQTPKT